MTATVICSLEQNPCSSTSVIAWPNRSWNRLPAKKWAKEIPAMHSAVPMYQFRHLFSFSYFWNLNIKLPGSPPATRGWLQSESLCLIVHRWRHRTQAEANRSLSSIGHCPVCPIFPFNNNNNKDFLCANFLVDQAQRRDKTLQHCYHKHCASCRRMDETAMKLKKIGTIMKWNYISF